MKIKLIFFFLIFIIFNSSVNATSKNNIINNFSKIDNLSFKFNQTIGEKTEEGRCTIKYPKKIFCTYQNKIGKTITANGKNIVIKNKLSNQYYLYPLKKTPLELILDKKFLIEKIKGLEERLIDNKYVNFTLIENNNVINIFFDKKSLNLVGWQTEDIYQNLVITFISDVKLNQKINDNIFILPKMN